MTSSRPGPARDRAREGAGASVTACSLMHEQRLIALPNPWRIADNKLHDAPLRIGICVRLAAGRSVSALSRVANFGHRILGLLRHEQNKGKRWASLYPFSGSASNLRTKAAGRKSTTAVSWHPCADSDTMSRSV